MHCECSGRGIVKCGPYSGSAGTRVMRDYGFVALSRCCCIVVAICEVKDGLMMWDPGI